MVEDKEIEFEVEKFGKKDKMEKLRAQIENYVPYNDQEEKDKQTILKYVDTFDDVLTRDNEFGHFTASSWAVNKDRTKVIMIYHNIYKSWAWTGGHADGETDLGRRGWLSCVRASGSGVKRIGEMARWP